MLEAWGKSLDVWGFWSRWWKGAIEGAPLSEDLQSKVALIADADWEKGPEHIAGVITGIESELSPSQSVDPIGQEIAHARVSNSKLNKEYIDRVRHRVCENRQTLPPTIDALQGLIVEELNRWQTSNELNATMPEECARQIRFLLTMHEALTGLRNCIPKAGLPSEEQAKEIVGLGKLYLDKFAALPREKADDVAQGAWNAVVNVSKAGMVLGTTSLCVQFGIPALAGVAVGTTIFAPKSAAEVIKVAKEYLSKSDGK